MSLSRRVSLNLIHGESATTIAKGSRCRCSFLKQRHKNIEKNGMEVKIKQNIAKKLCNCNPIFFVGRQSREIFAIEYFFTIGLFINHAPDIREFY